MEKYRDFRLEKEYNFGLFCKIGVIVLGIYTAVVIAVLDIAHKPIVYLPHILFMMAFVFLTDINESRRKHNDMILDKITETYNRIDALSRRLFSLVQ